MVFFTKCRIYLLLLIPILILTNIIYNSIGEPEDISNMPHSQIPQFKALQADTALTKIHKHETKDYFHLIDVDFSFKIKPDVCEDQHPFLLIMIHSAVENFEKRRAVRETWGRSSAKTKLVFLLGSSGSREMEEKVTEESNIFSDLVVGSFLDSYKNLTYKHVMGLKFAVYHCAEARYILKTDDDVFVNAPLLVDYIRTNISQYGAEKLLMCNVWQGAKVARSFRSKYRSTYKEVPFKVFPNYCSGWFILYSPDVVHDLYDLAQVSEYYWVDDVFVTGILAERLKIPHFNARNIVITKKRLDRIAEGFCDAKLGSFMLGRPNLGSDLMRKLWSCALMSDIEIRY